MNMNEEILKRLKEKNDLLNSRSDHPPGCDQIVALLGSLGFERSKERDQRWVWMHWPESGTEIAVPRIRSSRDYKRRAIEAITDAVNAMGWNSGMAKEMYLAAQEFDV